MVKKMVEIKIDEATRNRIHASGGLLDDVNDVLNEALDALDDSRNPKTSAPHSKTPKNTNSPTPRNCPIDVRHSKITRIRLGAQETDISDWNVCLRWVVEKLMSNGGVEYEKIKKSLQSRIVRGEKPKDNFKPIPSQGVYVRMISATDAYNSFVALAKNTGTKIELHIAWNKYPNHHAKVDFK